MVSLDKAVIGRLEREGFRFEILIDPDAAQAIREDQQVDLSEALAVEEIFKDAKKGDRASEENIQKVFGDASLEEIVKRIVNEGEIQLTTDQRRRMQEEKRKQIIAYIVRNSINPQTKTPHPPQRIETALKEAKVPIDPLKPVDVQVKNIVKALRPLLPISFEKMKVAVRVSGEDYARVYADLRAYGELIQEEWQEDGRWIGLFKMPAGISEELEERLRRKCKGSVEIKIID